MTLKTKLLNILNTFSIKTLISILLHKPYIIIYPIFLTILLLLLRFMRLGNTIDLVTYCNISLISNLLFIVFFWPYISVWLRLIMWKIMDIRLAMWNDFIILITLIHTYLLQFDLYFFVVSRFHKLAFLWLTFICHDGYIYKNKPNLLRIMLHKIYLYPVISTICLILIYLLEVIITCGKLKYSLYLTFIFIIIRSLLSFVNDLAISSWVKNCCISDYIYQHWDRPRYPTEFWCNFYSIRMEVGIIFEISQQLEEVVNLYIIKAEVNRKATFYRLHKLYNNKKVRQTNIFAFPIKYSYYTWYQVRWTHTEAIKKESQSIFCNKKNIVKTS